MGITAVRHGFSAVHYGFSEKKRFSAEGGADLRCDIHRSLQIP